MSSGLLEVLHENMSCIIWMSEANNSCSVVLGENQGT